MQPEELMAPVLTTEDIGRRYRCGRNTASRYVREIKAFNGGGALGKGRVTAEEVVRYERRNFNTTTEEPKN